jgi:hypothetical protein
MFVLIGIVVIVLLVAVVGYGVFLKKEVFVAYMNYSVPSTGAVAAAAKLGRLATEQELLDAYKAGADWCVAGWVQAADGSIVSRWPHQGAATAACGSEGIMNTWNNGAAGVIVYGVKPSVSSGVTTANGVLPFNSTRWNQ